jgi:hypothetical protein
MRAAVFIFFCVLFGLPISATNLYVSVAGTNDTPPFTNWPLSCSNIQWVVNGAANNDTVWVSNGTYYLTNQINITAPFVNIMVKGYTNNGIVTVDGQSNYQCFFVSAYLTNVTIDGFNIVNGFGNSANGGGIAGEYGLAVQNCTLSNNTAKSGGGIYYANNRSGYQCIISNCTIVNNTATNMSGNTGGGAIFSDGQSGNLVIDNCWIQSNYSKCHGGGIFIYGGPGILRNCTIASNTANFIGGGIRLSNYGPSLALIANCTIINNSTTNGSGSAGGGIYCGGSSGTTITNCRVIGNWANGYGAGGIDLGPGGQLFNSSVISNSAVQYMGGVDNSGGLVKNCIVTYNIGAYGGIANLSAATNINCLIAYNISGYGGGIYDGNGSLNINCTIVSNTASSKGGGYYASGITSLVENCIIYYNTCSAGSNCYITNSAIYCTNCCMAPLTGLSGSGNISNNPSFVSKDAGDWHLAGNSPCINAGFNDSLIVNTTDLDGHHRIDPYSLIVDMGCYEYLPAGAMYRFGFPQ